MHDTTYDKTKLTHYSIRIYFSLSLNTAVEVLLSILLEIAFQTRALILLNVLVQPTYVTPLEQSAYTNRHQLNSDNTRNDYSAAQTAPRNVPSTQASYPHYNHTE